ncbi:uncharacterized protein LOC141914923 [Tubulanus polymorphus]|uniref:uncharacterized protein LOC141914923 n=1 Tax=Tubulanus polymorphus TaxID=672921 RepID=UPI003DA41D33
MESEIQMQNDQQVEPELANLKEDDETEPEGRSHQKHDDDEVEQQQVPEEDDQKPPITPVTPDAMKEKVEEPVEENYYVDPVEDPYKKAITYLEAHNILQLFQVMTASLVSQRPQDPIQFMIDEVDRLKTEKQFEAVVESAGETK